MPLDLAWHTALMIVADGLLFGIGFHVSALLVSAIATRLKRQS